MGEEMERCPVQLQKMTSYGSNRRLLVIAMLMKIAASLWGAGCLVFGFSVALLGTLPHGSANIEQRYEAFVIMLIGIVWMLPNSWLARVHRLVLVVLISVAIVQAHWYLTKILFADAAPQIGLGLSLYMALPAAMPIVALVSFITYLRAIRRPVQSNRSES